MKNVGSAVLCMVYVGCRLSAVGCNIECSNLIENVSIWFLFLTPSTTRIQHYLLVLISLLALQILLSSMDCRTCNRRNGRAVYSLSSFDDGPYANNLNIFLKKRFEFCLLLVLNFNDSIEILIRIHWHGILLLFVTSPFVEYDVSRCKSVMCQK